MDSVRRSLQSATSIAVLTGAGISAESGIPVFRGRGGLWRDYRPEDLATPAAFACDPKLVWEWYDWRRGIIAQAQPNAGHQALAELERRTGNFTLITQNVDGLHDRAGSREQTQSSWRHLERPLLEMRSRAIGSSPVDSGSSPPLPLRRARAARGRMVRRDVASQGMASGRRSRSPSRPVLSDWHFGRSLPRDWPDQLGEILRSQNRRSQHRGDARFIHGRCIRTRICRRSSSSGWCHDTSAIWTPFPASAAT